MSKISKDFSKDSQNPIIKRLFDMLEEFQRYPQKYLAMVSVAFSIFVLSGGMFMLFEGASIVGGVLKIDFFFNYNEALFSTWDATDTTHGIYYSADTLLMEYHGQYIIEWFIIILVLITGSGGIFLTRHSTRFAYDVRSATSRMILGWLLFVIAMAVLMFVMGQKNYNIP